MDRAQGVLATREKYDAVVVGSGPNGLAAAIALAQAGRRVQIVEAEETVGGGMRTAELTLPGFLHDVCSAVHPLGYSSPFFRSLPLHRHGLEWVQPDIPLAHPLDDGTAAALHRSLRDTAAGLGRDAAAYHALFAPFARRWEALAADLLGPPLRRPGYPLLLARFGLPAMRSAAGLARARFRDAPAAALFAGIAAHATVPLERPLTASFGLVLGAAGHAAGWPVARGGSGTIAAALESCARALGVSMVTGRRVRHTDDVPPAGAVLFDVTPRQLLRIAGHRLPAWYRWQLARYRYGPGVFKVDYALDGPVPWTAAACRRAGTVHVGGTLEEIAATERTVAAGGHPERPFVLVAQQSIADPTRAPAGKHTLWAYCHVPNGSTEDMTGRIEAQIERFAPGFQARILARHVMTPAALERHNENYVGGDIGGGSSAGLQLILRPAAGLAPYRTPSPGIYLCSSSTPPGGGVHGMCGYWAARAALRGGG